MKEGRLEFEHIAPRDIENTSMSIISRELAERGITLDPENEAVIKRCIHTSADFDYAENLTFSEHAVMKFREALKSGSPIVTDTQMARSGISKKTLAKYGGEVFCFMSDSDVAAEAKARGVTRASVSMEKAAGFAGSAGAEAKVPIISPEGAADFAGSTGAEAKSPEIPEEGAGSAGSTGAEEKVPELPEGAAEPAESEKKSKKSVKSVNMIFAVGNAPTALITLYELMEKHDEFRPAGIIGVPVGFVNVVDSKELIIEGCKRFGVPYIVARGRKGGSNIAAAICNALLYGMGPRG